MLRPRKPVRSLSASPTASAGRHTVRAPASHPMISSASETIRCSDAPLLPFSPDTSDNTTDAEGGLWYLLQDSRPLYLQVPRDSFVRKRPPGFSSSSLSLSALALLRRCGLCRLLNRGSLGLLHQRRHRHLRHALPPAWRLRNRSLLQSELRLRLDRCPLRLLSVRKESFRHPNLSSVPAERLSFSTSTSFIGGAQASRSSSLQPTVRQDLSHL